MPTSVKIIECPRDAWQGLPKIIPAARKVEYLTALVHAGFRHIDAVSFVSPKHVTQMADSEDVMRELEPGLAARAQATRHRNYRHRGERTGHGTRARNSRRDHPRLSLLDFRLFSPRECEYDARGIARGGREIARGYESRRPRSGRLHFDGIWKSVR